MRTRGWGGALLLAAGVVGCAEGPMAPGASDGAAPDRPPAAEGGTDASGDGSSALACAWEVVAPELKLPESDLQGVLRGSSRNASTTCTRQKGTGGPEAFYILRLSERSLVDLEVISELDTVLAIRRACDDPLTEVACSDGPGAGDGEMKFDAAPPPDVVGRPSPPPGPVDAGVKMDPLPAPGVRSVGTRDAHLRASLPAGSYYVLVDEAEPFGVGGPFQLRVRTSSPPIQTSCTTAPVVADGTRLLTQELDLASEKTPCGGETARPALFYRAVIPAGARITARALPTSGDWTPALQVFTSCGAAGSDGGANLCLAADQLAVDGLRTVRYVNNGPDDQPVLLAVSSTAAVWGATFRLDVSIAQPLQNVTCQAAQPLSDGLMLPNQDLSQGQIDNSSFCKPGGSPSLFYRAQLLPRQSLHVSVLPAEGPSFPRVLLLVHESCSDGSCPAQGANDLFFTNTSASSRSVVIEATSFDFTSPPFTLRADMPLPPGGISVQAAQGLLTSESGGQATFQVVLTSPGTEVVEIPISSSDPQEGTVAPATLHFSPDNWDRPQMVTVTGVDDDRADGRRPYTVRIGPSVSNDPRYAGLEGGKVALENLDDEPGFRIDAPATLITAESGAQATFQVSLNRAPTATVRLPLSSSDEGEGTVSVAELVFEPDTWNQPQTVTVLGIDDDQQDGSQPYQVVIGAASSGDARYQGIDPDDLPARNGDDDFQRVAARPVNDPSVCYFSGAYESNQLLAVDQATTLYAGFLCQYRYMPAADAGAGSSPVPSQMDAGDRFPTARVATSVDGGRTFGALVDTGLPVYQLALAGGRPGLVVAAGSGPTGILITRSEDSGATWQPVQVLDPSGSSIRLAAAGDRVVVHTQDGPAGPSYWISEDGARTFGPRKSAAALPLLGLDADGTLWAFAFDGMGLSFRTSKDGGVTFIPGPLIPFEAQLRAVAVAPTLLYGAGKELQVVPRDRSATLHPVATIPPSDYPGPFLVTDQKDNVVVLTVASGQAEARRLNAGESTLAPAKPLGSSSGSLAAVPLSDRAIAVMLFNDGTASVAVETWP